MKTAITVEATPNSYWTNKDNPFEPRREQAKLPSGFIPDECFCRPCSDIHLRIEDAEGALIDVNTEAFQFGPLAFWRKPFGFIFVITTLVSSYVSHVPCTYVVLRGEIR